MFFLNEGSFVAYQSICKESFIAEFHNQLHNLVDFHIRQFIEQWQSYQGITISVTIWQLSAIMLVLIELAAMQWQVMECGLYIILLQEFHQSSTILQTWTEQIEHVSIVGGILWDIRQLHFIANLTIQALEIAIPDMLALTLNIIKLLQLSPKICSIEL